MTPEQRRLLIEQLKKARDRQGLNRLLEQAFASLDESLQPQQKRAALEELIKVAAQDNTSTLKNSGEAQEIVNQILKSKGPK